MNWGYGIAIFYSLFVVAMLSAVIASTQYDPGLISKNYYDLDLHYQEHYDKKVNTAALATPVTVHFDAETREVVVVFPEDMPVNSGSIQFRRTSTVKDDFEFAIPALKAGQALRIPANELAHGRWLMDIDWTSADKGFFFATSVSV